jgi:hypothetical protein
MIVYLGQYQARTVMTRVPPKYAEAMKQHRRSIGLKRHEYDLPAIAWRQIRDHLISTQFGPLGGKLRNLPAEFYGAFRKISERVMILEGHPAFLHQAALGWSSEILVGFEGERSGPLVPYPQPGYRFVLLIPHWRNLNGLDVTVWEPGEPPLGGPDRDSYREEFHLFFRGE